jgi:hypothetical protein
MNISLHQVIAVTAATAGVQGIAIELLTKS